jgi:hypothetical protein
LAAREDVYDISFAVAAVVSRASAAAPITRNVFVILEILLSLGTEIVRAAHGDENRV